MGVGQRACLQMGLVAELLFPPWISLANDYVGVLGWGFILSNPSYGVINGSLLAAECGLIAVATALGVVGLHRSEASESLE